METPGPTSGTPPVTSTTAATAAVRWQLGQLLQATVMESNAGKVLLSIGNRQVSSETSLLLDKGQQLTVQIRSLGDTPVLRITSGLTTPPLAQAIRTLVPQQDTMTPLLASLARLAQTPRPPVPPLIRELTQAMVRNLPDTTAATRPESLRKAIEQSGLFLERRLAQQINPNTTPASNPTPVSAIQSDFKANLLQLIHQLRSWPGSVPTPSPSSAANPSVQATVTPTGGPLPAAPAALGETSHAALPVRTGNPNINSGKVAENPVQATPVSADQLRRVVQSGTQAPLADTRSALATTPLLTTTSPTTGTTTGTVSTVLPGAVPVPPPFPGTAPAPQAAAQATIDLVNRIGNLHTDLLRQAEAALARIQLHQLASQPREAERGLLEWLLELPVKRGDDIDLWSMRIAREGHDSSTPKRKTRRSWSVQLAFDLPGLGPVQAQITLTGEQISTRFWAGKEGTLPLFREHLQELQHMLGNVGLEVGELDCVPGPMPTNATAPSLIREKV